MFMTIFSSLGSWFIADPATHITIFTAVMIAVVLTIGLLIKRRLLRGK